MVLGNGVSYATNDQYMAYEMTEYGLITVIIALVGVLSSALSAYVAMKLSIGKLQTKFEDAEKRRDERIVELLGQRDQRLSRNEKDIDDASKEVRDSIASFQSAITQMRQYVEENLSALRHNIYDKISLMQKDVSDTAADVRVVKERMDMKPNERKV